MTTAGHGIVVEGDAEIRHEEIQPRDQRQLHEQLRRGDVDEDVAPLPRGSGHLVLLNLVALQMRQILYDHGAHVQHQGQHQVQRRRPEDRNLKHAVAPCHRPPGALDVAARAPKVLDRSCNGQHYDGAQACRELGPPSQEHQRV
eukprot:CAMPEP_0117463266 /NCGR_PEP_ID=MMETSP0784-20121206/3488_1 /TAXON_ID=39447 /ORGANISM="" /LENGTH=143 /DNA_ID=CAMNT_0005257071 /DNA_START=458 /DNA_END=890 /DNA_ORIENTATION=+